MAFAFLLITGCATSPALSETAQQQLPRQSQLSDVPFHAQRDYQCGPASLAMVLHADGVDVEVDTLIPQVFLPGREGSVQPEMLATVRRHGRIPFVLDTSFEALVTELAAGRPVVVMQNLSLPAWPLWHYAVAIGYDLDTREMTLHSGEEAARIESFRRFNATWARSDRWAFVALPPGELPEGVAEDRALEAIADYEQVQGAAAALPAWEALVGRFPDSALGHFALGNARYELGDIEGAIEAFEHATDIHPDLAVGWLNLGLALQEQGQRDAAQEALTRAATLPGRWQAKAEAALGAQ
ncbi:PA2778 family cysteine peptidase [Halomonas campisalis]|uniref:PA2778 family cysteine peptidase n=1 Tax=Billgrantia campisalis TaxID=74661 RepID=UPI001EF06609|nr:PA2778 family cysteine peptidase [Halomonas campisalis]MDR5861505.1 PA2778 family cysteine peptidase [Halomonas campisalis]